MGKIFWIVGQWHGTDYKNDETHQTWSIVGAAYTEKLAISFCTKKTHFVGPIEMDKRFSDDDIEWKGCYYPLIEKEKYPTPPVSLEKHEYELAGGVIK